MITKIDNPKTRGSKQYSNKGSAAQLKNYLISNEDKLDKDDLFFDGEKKNISGDEMLRKIDNNVKGLGKDDHKFFSMSLNPSHDELAWIGNDKDKFKSFVQETMKNYAKSFKKGGISEKDLVWGAIIHEKRYFSKKEVYVWNKKNEGQRIHFKEGDMKPGNQMHAHIIVSARNKGMTKTLNVLTAQNKVSRYFELKGFQKRNQDSFQNMFHFKNGVNVYVETQKNLVAKKIEQLERLGYPQRDFEKIYRVGERMNFNAGFTRNLNRLVQERYQLHAIVNTEKYLELGDKKYREAFPEGIIRVEVDKQYSSIKEPGEEWNALFAAINDIGNAATRMNQPSKKAVEEEEEKKRRRKRGMGF